MPGSKILSLINKKFSENILTDNGELNRQYMRKLIFDNPVKRKSLEAILHPEIQKEVSFKLLSSSGPYQIIVVPLLTTSPLRHKVNRILVIDCDEKTQIDRLIKRDGGPLNLAKKIVASQGKRNDRLSIADDVINNDCDFQKIIPKIKAIHRKYLKLSME